MSHIISVENEPQIHVDESARARIAHLREKSGKPGLVLRVSVEGGGCSGFQYKMTLADGPESDEKIFGGCVATDPLSLDFLKDSEILFESGLTGSEFKVDNPNAASGCGCGLSFSVKSENL